MDEKIKPWLIEVNSLASFATDSPLDKKVKYDLMLETFKLLNLSPKRKKKMKKARQEKINRRQSKDAITDKLNKANRREALRKSLQKERDKIDLSLIEQYRRAFPSDNPSR